MAFTTWADLYKKMLDDFASGSWRTKSYDIDGVRKEFFAPSEFREMLAMVESRAAAEQTNVPTRTVARGANR